MALKVKVIDIWTGDTILKAAAIEKEISKWLKDHPVEIVNTNMMTTEGRNILFTIIYKDIEL